MLRSMFAAVSGLQAHQTFMDVVGNNISNVNTTGFKAGTVEFEDLLSQTINGAGAPATNLSGGTNPAQVGLGVRLAGIGTNFSQGAAAGDGPLDRLRDSGRRLLRRAAGRGAGLHAQRQLLARRSRTAGHRRRRPRAGLAGRPAGQRQHQLQHGPREDPRGPDDRAGHDREHQRRRQPPGRLGRRDEDRHLDRREQQPRRIDPAAHGVHEGRRHRGQHQLDRHDLRQRRRRHRGAEQRPVRRQRQPHVGQRHAHAGAAQRDPRHLGNVVGGRRGHELRGRDRGRSAHGRRDAEQCRRVVAGRLGHRFAGQLQCRARAV